MSGPNELPDDLKEFLNDFDRTEIEEIGDEVYIYALNDIIEEDDQEEEEDGR